MRRFAASPLLAAALLALTPAPASAVEAPDHQLLGAITGDRIGPGQQFKDACGVAVDSHGDVYVADYYDNRVVVFDADWRYLTTIASIEPLGAGAVKPLNGPCGLAVGPEGALYVNSYHGAVRRYAPSAYPPAVGTSYGLGQVIDAGPATGLAADPETGDLYVNRRTYIARYEAPVSAGSEGAQRIGEGSLGDGYGVALSGFEGDGNYPSTKGLVYVADAAADRVKVYDPAADPESPQLQIRGEATAQGRFHLADAELAVDSRDGHLYVSDNLEPGFEENPRLVVDELSPAGYYRGSVPPSFLNGSSSFLRAAEPSGLAIGTGGRLYVTSGNFESAAVYAFGPPAPAVTHLLEVVKAGTGLGTVTSTPAGLACGPSCVGEFDAETPNGSEALVALKATPSSGSAFAGWYDCDQETVAGGCVIGLGSDRVVTAQFVPAPSPSAIASAAPGPYRPEEAARAPGGSNASPAAGRAARGRTIVQKGGVRVALTGRLAPRALPRRGFAPVSVTVGGDISTTDGSRLPQLKRLRIELNRGGHLETASLPVCSFARIRVASSARALEACRGALVGQGSFAADVVLRGQQPYPTTGKLLVFNGRQGRRSVLYGHIYSSKPFATSFVIPFEISSHARGAFGTVLTASLPQALGHWGYVTSLRMKLFRRYRSHGRRRSYISAGCPAPKGFPGATFSLARATFSFAGGGTLAATLARSCKVG